MADGLNTVGPSATCAVLITFQPWATLFGLGHCSVRQRTQSRTEDDLTNTTSSTTSTSNSWYTHDRYKLRTKESTKLSSQQHHNRGGFLTITGTTTLPHRRPRVLAPQRPQVSHRDYQDTRQDVDRIKSKLHIRHSPFVHQYSMHASLPGAPNKRTLIAHTSTSTTRISRATGTTRKR